ncbi:MAG: OadG family transporter subunit, partial [Candidatus Gallimonas sp.]
MNALNLLDGWFQFPVGDGAFYAVFGFLFVFFGITLLILILTALGKILDASNKKKRAKVVPAAPVATELKREEKTDEIAPEVVAAITAALAA